MSKAKDLQRHLVEPPEEWVAEKAELFALRPPPEGLWICNLRRILKKMKWKWVVVQPPRPGVPDPGPLAERLPVLGQLDRLVRERDAGSLDRLKALVGVPNAALLAGERIGPLAQTERFSRHPADGEPPVQRPLSRLAPLPVELRHLPTSRKINFKKLSEEQRVAVWNQAFNLVYGYADPEAIERPPLRAVVDYLLSQARALPVLALDSLIVCDEEVVEFSNFSGLWVNNVVIEGSGEVKLGSRTKLHAYSVKRV